MKNVGDLYGEVIESELKNNSLLKSLAKDNKKLESRQDVLDVWVSKGAVYSEEGIERCTIDELSYVEVNVGSKVYLAGEGGSFLTAISSVLYSPESNFFEVMFGVSDAPRIVMKSKADCVNRKNPLDRILKQLNTRDNLNDTTS